MQYETAYNTLKQAINNLDSTQMAGATKEDIAAMIGADVGAKFWSSGNEGFFINLKRNIIAEKQRAEQQTKVDSFQKMLRKIYPQCDVVLMVDGALMVYLTGRREDIING